MERLKPLIVGIGAIFLVVGFTLPLYGGGGYSDTAPPAPKPPGAAAGAGSTGAPAGAVSPGPHLSPDQQRFRPETTGQAIRQNREEIRKYKGVSPPATSESKGN